MLLSLFKLLIYLDNAKSCSVFFFNRKDVMLKKIWCDIQWNKSKMFWTLSTSSHGQFATEELSLEPSKNVSNYRNAWLATVSRFDLSLWKKPVPVQRQTSLKKNTNRKKQQNESVRSQESINPPTEIAKVLHQPNITKFGSTSLRMQSETPEP